MLRHQDSSSSLPAVAASWDATSTDPSWPETPESSSCASSVAERSVRHRARVRSQGSVWRSFFVGRSRSVPDPPPDSPDHLAPRPGTVEDDREQCTVSREGSTTSRPGSVAEAERKRSPRTSIRSGWRSTRQADHVGGSASTSSLADAQEIDDGAPKGWGSHLFGKSGRPAGASLSRPFRPSTRYESSDRPQRPSVSEPYNFRHLQHVASNEASRLHHAISVDSFSTIRTARPASRRLQDIKAERFPSSFRLSPDLPGARRTIGRSPPVSPCSMPPDHRGDNSDGSPLVSDTPGEAGHPTWREDESKGTRRRSAQSTMSIIPPPRTSSRNAFTHVDDPVLMSPSTASHLSDGADSADRKFERVDLRASDVSIRPGSAGSLDESTWQFEELQLPHAVTTPDDTAWPLKPATVADGRPGLADVPEEDEGYFSPRLDPTSPKESSFTPSWPSCSHGQTLSVTHTSRTSLSSVDSTTQARDSFRSQSQVSESLERDSFVRVVKGPSETPKAPGSISIQVRDLDASWEDDIDYCYEHAVEADCAYDWDWNPDEDTPTKDGQATSGMSADEYSAIVPSASSHRSSGSVDGLQTMSAGQATLGHLPDQPICRHRPNLLVRTADETPILEPSSAVTSMNGSELVTPSPLEVRLSSAHPFKNSGITVVDPSLRFTDQDNSWTPEETLDVGSPTGGVHATTTHIPDEPMTNRLDSLPGLLGDSEVGSSSRQSEEVATGHQSSRPGPTDNATQIIAEARCVEVGLAEPVAHNCSAPADETSGGSLQKAFSHDDVHSSQHSYSPMLNRARSPSEGTGKGMAGTRRKPDPRAIKRNRSMSAIGLSRAQPPTRASYALFPLAS